jgi:SNF2 family DNA or RNA helicase
MIGTTIDIDSSSFVIEDQKKELFSNFRLRLTLKRWKAEFQDGLIRVPFDENLKEALLDEIQSALENLNIEITLSEDIKLELESFSRDKSKFHEFKNHAKLIRNEEISKDSQFYNEFQQFRSFVDSKFIRPLKNFQELSAFHMAFSQHSCNFSVPGAGKTAVVLAAYSYLKNHPDKDKRVDRLVVIGPFAAFAPWENEFEACLGKKVTSNRIYGGVSLSQRKEHLATGEPPELTLINYHSVPLLNEEIASYIKRNNVMVVADEAHRIKRQDGQHAVNTLDVVKNAKSRIVLTGTPLPNGYHDLFNLYKFIYPFHYQEILGFHYSNLFEMNKADGLDSPRVTQLIENTSPFFIRIKKQHLSLPPIKKNHITVKMDTGQRFIYDFIEAQFVNWFEKSESDQKANEIMNKAKLIRLRQASTNPSLLYLPISESLDIKDKNLGEFDKDLSEELGDSSVFDAISDYRSKIPPKFSAILELISSQIIPNKEKVIVWTIFVSNADQLQSYLNQNSIKSKLLIGRIEDDEREEVIESFNNPNNMDFQVVIANPFTIGESVSLHKGCHNAIYLERDYNCASYLQSLDRIHRVGLDPNQVTTYHYFLSQDSVDEIINEKINIKIERMAKVIDGEIPLLAGLDENNEVELGKEILLRHDQRNSSV